MSDDRYYPHLPTGPYGTGPGAYGGGPATAYPGQHGGCGPGASQAAHPQAQARAAWHAGDAPYPGNQHQAQTPFFNFGNERFLKGMLIGAAAAYLLTNESVQRSAIKGAVRVWSMLQGGVAELKERFHDAEAEIRAAEAGHGE